MIPSRLSNFHPFKCTDKSKNITVDSKDNVEYVKPNMNKNGKFLNMQSKLQLKWFHKRTF